MYRFSLSAGGTEVMQGTATAVLDANDLAA
jgi:hypothetical protein